ncbi:exported hypothetical protein [Candidatus Sulfopaludibacter sp. SbA3]|nr:exported hypothetical protein [Candidatus Sulfopaludibacter sp. SbA3]
MPRRFAVAVPAALLCAAVAANAQEWRSGIDSRIELMSILFRLAGNREYHQCRVPAYDKAVEKYFAPYRDHEAVQLARSLAMGFEAPVKLAVYLRDTESLEERVPFVRPGVHLYPAWDPARVRVFLAAARRFAAETNFQGFLRSQQPLYDATNARLQAFLRDQADLGWFARFLGPQPPAYLVVVPGMANGAPSYAARFVDESGTQEIYAVPGISKVDGAGLPVFDSAWRAVLVNELAHVYLSPAVAKFAARMQKPVRQMYEAVAPAMQQQSYGDSRTVLNQSLSRAVAIEYVMEHEGPEAARIAIQKENSRSFFWMAGLVDLLESYRKGRDHYPTFDSFMPRVAQFFNETAPKIRELTDRLQPKVVATSIPEGARDVDPGTKQIVIRFSMPMGRVGPNKSSKISGGRFDTTGMVFTITVTLEPERDYAIPLRWSGGQTFVSADGVPLPAVTLRFHTAPAPSPKRP